MAALGVADGEKIILVLLAVVSWLVMGRQMQRAKQNCVSTCIIIGSVAVILWIGYMGVKSQIQGF